MVCAYGGITAIKGISMEVRTGQLVALIGANGAGKSTTLRAISGLVPPSSGSLVFDGRNITRASPPRILACGIAHCPEGRRVFPHMSVEENLNMGAYLRADVIADDGGRAAINDGGAAVGVVYGGGAGAAVHVVGTDAGAQGFVGARVRAVR